MKLFKTINGITVFKTGCLRLCLLILLPFNILSQTDSDLLKVKPGKNGDVYVCGNYYGILKFTNNDSIGTFYSNGNTMFLCKLDSLGTVLWYKNIKGVANWMLDLGMAVDASDNVLITSSFMDTLSVGSASLAVHSLNYKMFLLKFSSAGNLLWSKTAGGNAGFSSGSDVTVDKDKNVYVTGEYRNGDIHFGCASVSSGTVDQVFVSKYDSLGNCNWINGIYGNPQNVRGITLGKTGDVYVNGDAGPSFMFSPGVVMIGANTYSATYTSRGSYIVRFSSNGSPLMLMPQTYSGPHATMEGVVIGKNEQVFGAGQMSLLSDFGNLQLSTSSSGNTSDGFVVKYKPSGADIWAKQASGGLIGSNNFGCINGIAYDSLSHKIILAGRHWPLINYSPLGSFTFPPNKYQYLVTLDTMGLGLCMYNLLDYELVIDVSADAKGFMYTTGSNSGSSGIRVSKFTTNCGAKWSVYFKTYGYIPPVSLKEFEPEGIALFPNPADKLLNIKSAGASTISIYDASGKLIASKHFRDAAQMETYLLPNGLYLAEISSEKGIVRRKLIIKHD